MVVESSSSLKEYLKRYESNNVEDEKKKKKRKKKPSADNKGVILVDEDPTWQKQVNIEEELHNSSDEEKPQIDEDIEVKRMKRLEELKAKRPFGVISEDGSGWIPVSNTDVADADVADADLSPPRKRRARNDTPSPRGSDSGDLSPPRKSRDRDLSPPRKNRDRDLSPPRKNRDLSPPRRKAKTGLVTGRDVKEEVNHLKMEELERFKKMDPSESGRGAKGVYRDKATGKRMTEEEFLEAKQKLKANDKPKEIKIEWGKGLVQKREAEEKLKEIELEKEKPFARSKDDPEIDKMLKDRVRWGDPMAHLVKKKVNEDEKLKDFGEDEKVKESGFVIPQDVPSHSWIKRRLDCPPNRYGIKPGRHWDGVDRSNGTEKTFFKRQNEKQATEREAYMWSVEDM